MPYKWFRCHSDVINSKRLQRIHAELFRLWINCQCILSLEGVGSSGKLPPIEDCAYFLRMSVEETVNNFDKLVDAGLLLKRNETKMKQKMKQNETKSTVSCVENETLFETQNFSYFVKNWGKKQYKSDSSTERVKRFRERQRGVSETPTDTDTEQNRINTDSNLSNFNISIFLNDDDYEKIKQQFQGWDIQHYIEKFNNFVKSKKKRPDHPRAAFIGFIKKDTEGKTP